MPELTELTECTAPEAECATPDTIAAGHALLTLDPTTRCNRLLNHVEGSIPVSDGTTVQHRTGATGDEISLISLRAMSPAAFPRLLAQDNAGSLGHIPAPESCVPQILVGKDGSYSFEIFEAPVCHSLDAICECPPDQYAGFVTQQDCEGNDRLCLVRFDVPEAAVAAALFFASTSCIEKTGVGTEGDPYKFSIKISADQNNCIECRDDGLYVACGVYDSGYDPLD